MSTTALFGIDTASLSAEVIEFITQHNGDKTVITEDMVKTYLPKLRAALDMWNKAYRTGNPMVDDAIYDIAADVYEQCGGEITDTHADLPECTDRMQKLPIIAASMNKCSNIEELRKWAKSKGFDFDGTLFTISPKYDGITLVKQENESFNRVWTKGRDGMGIFVPNHYEMINYGGTHINGFGQATVYSRGEAIMKKSAFTAKYSKAILGDKLGFENPRNMVSGKFTDKEVNLALKDVDYIRFHIDTEAAASMSKKEQFDVLNEVNAVKIPYVQMYGGEINETSLHIIFNDWASGDHEIDGLIIDIDSPTLRNELGLETSSNNPCFARAFKGDWVEYADTEVVALKRQISKQGYLKPVIVIKPVRLNGVTVTNIYVDNERWIQAYGIGIGSKLTVKRAGMVIPRVAAVEGVKVVSAEEFNKIARKMCLLYCEDNMSTGEAYLVGKKMREALGIAITNYRQPFEEEVGGAYKWNDSGVELMLVEENEEVTVQKNIAFFELIGAKGISDGIITELYEKGYKTIPQILALTNGNLGNIELMASWDGWGERRAEIITVSVKKAMGEVKYTKLMHATGFFGKLGSKKLDLVQHFPYKPTMEQLIDVKGFDEISAKEYLGGYDKFRMFIDEIGYRPKAEIKEEVVATGNKCAGWKVTFTQFRDKELEALIIQNGGEIKDSISKGSTHLVLKDKGKGTSKEVKAQQLGAEIWTREEMVEYFD